jgi:hypothetical protein
VLAGGLAFDSPPDAARAAPAPENTVFTLFGDRRSALAPADGVAVPIRMTFDQSVRGLVPGAAIDLLGVDIGRVRGVALQYDAQRKRFPVEVAAEIYPLRLGAVRSALLRDAGGASDAGVVQQLAANGLRAQLRTGNLLTGQLYVALDFIPGPAKSAAIDSDGAVRMPTAPGTLSELQPQIAEIVQKVSKIPFDDIGRDLRTTLQRTSSAIGQLTPDAQKTLAEVQRTLGRAQTTFENLDRNVTDPNSPVQRSLEDTLLELQRTSRALRVLSDYLQQHPEALLRGKPADAAVRRAEPPCENDRLRFDFARRARLRRAAIALAVLALGACGNAAADALSQPDAARGRGPPGAPAAGRRRGGDRPRADPHAGAGRPAAVAGSGRRLGRAARAGAMGEPVARRIPPGAARRAHRRPGRGRGAHAAGAGRRHRRGSRSTCAASNRCPGARRG